MTAVEFIDYCLSAFMELDYQTKVIFVLAEFITILIFSWLHLLLKWSITRIIKYFKNRGNKNA